MEINELSKDAHGGTEQMLARLYRDVDTLLLNNFQIIPTRVRKLEPNKKRILWVHDLPNDPEVIRLLDSSFRNNFHGIVFVSQYQRTKACALLGIPVEQTVVMENAVEPFYSKGDHTYFDDVFIDGSMTKVQDKAPVIGSNETIRLIYHTTPHRGLEILLPVFKELVDKEGENLLLDVYSSFEMYGWPERDKEYEYLFEQCRRHPAIIYHGYQPNSTIRAILSQDTHLFAFPSIWPETSCIAMIEAMCAGVRIVSSDLGALPDTLGGFGAVYPHTKDKEEHKRRFAKALRNEIDYLRARNITCSKGAWTHEIRSHRMLQRDYAHMRYNWKKRTKDWTTYLEGLL